MSSRPPKNKRKAMRVKNNIANGITARNALVVNTVIKLTIVIYLTSIYVKAA